MKPAPFAYHRPTALPEALALLTKEPGAKVLAGGQSLIPLLSMRLASPATLVDINALPDLDHVDVTADGVRIGALARHADVLASEEVRRVQPLVSLALNNVAHATIRNRGTTVGSLVHADAAAEMPVVLRLVGGAVEAASERGTRTIPADELFIGPLESSLEADELAVAATFPALAPNTGVAFEEIARRHGDYALCGVAALVTVEDQKITGAKAGYLSVSDLPEVLDLTEPLLGQRADAITDEALANAAEQALAALDPADDVHATAAYRAQLARVLTARVIRTAAADALERTA